MCVITNTHIIPLVILVLFSSLFHTFSLSQHFYTQDDATLSDFTRHSIIPSPHFCIIIFPISICKLCQEFMLQAIENNGEKYILLGALQAANLTLSGNKLQRNSTLWIDKQVFVIKNVSKAYFGMDFD